MGLGVCSRKAAMLQMSCTHAHMHTLTVDGLMAAWLTLDSTLSAPLSESPVAVSPPRLTVHYPRDQVGEKTYLPL